MVTIFWDTEDILLVDFKGRKTVISTYENVLRKLTKNLPKICGKLYQIIFSTTTMPLLIPPIKQGEYCENFNTSLGIHLLTYFLTFKNLFKGMLF